MDFKKPPGKKSSNPQTSYGIADEPYDPSGITLIGVEMGPKTSENVKDKNELEERCTGRIRVWSDFVEFRPCRRSSERTADPRKFRRSR